MIPPAWRWIQKCPMMALTIFHRRNSHFSVRRVRLITMHISQLDSLYCNFMITDTSFFFGRCLSSSLSKFNTFTDHWNLFWRLFLAFFSLRYVKTEKFAINYHEDCFILFYLFIFFALVALLFLLIPLHNASELCLGNYVTLLVW